MKHAVLLALIQAMRSMGQVRVVETHAGAGLYDLKGEAAQRSSEAEGGVGRLMAASELLDPLEALRRAVVAENPDGRLRFYPGSPLLAFGALRPKDCYTGFELRPDDFASLRTLLSDRKRSGGGSPALGARGSKGAQVQVQVKEADGYLALTSVLKGGELVLIDPPFERADDYDRAAEAAALAIARSAAVAIWVPVKDLETLDAFLRRIEALSPKDLILAEVRLRPLVNPMKMNGCAMVLVDAPDITAKAALTCDWVARICGDTGARGAVTRHR